MRKVNLQIGVLSEDEMVEIFKKFVMKPESYFRKSHNQYLKLSNAEKKEWFPKDFPRLASLFDFKEWIERYNISSVHKLLSTCSSDPELKYVSAKQITLCEYSSGNEYDLHAIDLPDKDYDMIIFNQTLEHLHNPFLCMSNLYNHLRPGGYLYTTVPVINIPHMIPFHFWGMTPMGLCCLSASVGFNILECGYWGNLSYINYIFTHNRWPNTSDVVSNGVIKNEAYCQSQTWVLLQK